MPYDSFICDDGENCKIEECLKKCRIEELFEAKRCLSRRTLTKLAEQREFTGSFSTTQLLNGTRESWLKIKKIYTVDPQLLIAAWFGTQIHEELENHTPADGSISEVRIHHGAANGAIDFYDASEKSLCDLKTYGSAKAAKVMGLHKEKIPTGSYFKNGNQKYRIKYVPGRRKRFELGVQLNDYRIKCEQGLNLPVDNLLCEILVRDGGSYMARSNGISQYGYLVKINKISDRWINRYMNKKAQDLGLYLDTDLMPPPCNERERWGGKQLPDGTCTPGTKCRLRCEVWEHCDLGIEARKDKTKEDDID